MAWNNWALGMGHGMEWNETKQNENRKTHTTSSLCAQSSKHSAVAAAAAAAVAAVAHRQRTQQQAGSDALWKLSERTNSGGYGSKILLGIPHQHSMLNAKQNGNGTFLWIFTYIGIFVHTVHAHVHTYIHTHRFANVWNVLYIGQKQLRCQRWDWPLTTSYKRAHTERHATRQSYKSTRSSHILHTYIHIVNIPNTCIHITFVCACMHMHTYICTYIFMFVHT